MLKVFRITVLLLTLQCITVSCTSTYPVTADLALINGKIWTVDDDYPVAEAVAVWNGTIIAVSTNESISSLVGDETKVIDLQGNLVLPGFIDNHTHFLTGGNWLSGVKLKDASNVDEFGERLRNKSQELPEGAWITGGTWDHDNWPGGKLPTAADIDKYVEDRPVFVTRYDGHMSVANSFALSLAGISSATTDPPGGIIVRKPGSRDPEGVLKDVAQGLVRRVIPGQSKAELRMAIEAAMAEAKRVGVTSLQDMNLNPANLRIYQELILENKMTVRIYGHWQIAQWQRLSNLGIIKNFTSGNWLKIGGLKGIVDGSIGSSTALFFEPYLQDPSTRGVFVTQPDILKEHIIEADKAGLNMAIHAIGFRANSEILDIFEEVIEVNGPGDRRFRIEHAQHIHPKDFKRFADLGIIASVQPYHAIDDGRFVEKRIGKERSKTTYPFKQFLDNGITMTFGSDWTVAPLDPIKGIDAAVTRRTTDGKNPDGWYPEQKITVEKAIKAYTISNAFAVFEENIKGSITVGKLADMVVLSQDILSIPVNDIVNTEVLYTIVDGKIVFEKK